MARNSSKYLCYLIDHQLFLLLIRTQRTPCLVPVYHYPPTPTHWSMPCWDLMSCYWWLKDRPCKRWLPQWVWIIHIKQGWWTYLSEVITLAHHPLISHMYTHIVYLMIAITRICWYSYTSYLTYPFLLTCFLSDHCMLGWYHLKVVRTRQRYQAIDEGWIGHPELAYDVLIDVPVKVITLLYRRLLWPIYWHNTT